MMPPQRKNAVRPELDSILRRYLEGRASRRDLRLFAAEFDWDDTSSGALALRPLIGELELLLEEVGEGFRPETELRSFVERIAGPSVKTRLA
jgi:hypothetical protein